MLFHILLSSAGVLQIDHNAKQMKVNQQAAAHAMSTLRLLIGKESGNNISSLSKI